MKPFDGRRRKQEDGQIILVLACVIVALMLCASLGVDLGLAYVTKARLVKAADAAALMGMENLSLVGQAEAKTLASNAFTANYPTTGLDANAPTVNISFSTNAGQEVVSVTATATIRTIFLAFLSGYRTLPVAANAQALRGVLAMAIALDRSGSMSSDGGGAALKSAVPTFLSYFNNTTDQVAMVSFASDATTDFPIATGFQSPIDTLVNSLNFSGATFGPGGLTLAKAQVDSVVPASGENLVKVVVYFTDGLVNTIQDTFSCGGPLGNYTYNYGGYDADEGDGNLFDFLNASNGNDFSTSCGSCGRGNNYGTDGYGLDYNGFPPYSCTEDCHNVTQFYSQQYSEYQSFSRANITAESQYRAITTANALRAEGVFVYSIGLGSDPSETFLQEIANDPNSPTYNPNQPQGLAVFAPDCPSSTCTQELQQVFQTIASKILLRLTQ